MKKIGFIGAGFMGKAIIKGLLGSGFSAIKASEATAELAQKTSKELGIEVLSDNKKLIENSDIIILAVKPKIIPLIANEFKNLFNEEKTIISIAAGISLKQLKELFGDKSKIVRAMPNTPALIGEGMSVFCTENAEAKNIAQQIFSSIGKCQELSEDIIDIATALSGSGPAFMYLVIEAMADSALRLGMPKKMAINLVAQTMLGASKMVLETNANPAELKDNVTTPGGCTAEGLAALETHNIRNILHNVIQATATKASGR